MMEERAQISNVIDLSEEFQACQSLNIRSQDLMFRVCAGFERNDYKDLGKSLRALFQHAGHLKLQIPVYGPRHNRGQDNSYRGALAFWNHAVRRLGDEKPDLGVRVALNALDHIEKKYLLYSDLKASVFGAVVNAAAEAVEEDPTFLPHVVSALEKILVNTAGHLGYPEMEALFFEAGETWRDLMAEADPTVRGRSIAVLTNWQTIVDEPVEELQDLLEEVKRYGHPALAGKKNPHSEAKSHLRLVVSNENP